MMGDNNKLQDELFYSFNLDDVVPDDHLLRQIDQSLDFSELREHLAPYYGHTGRPPIDPEPMIRMLLIGYCLGIRSERQLCMEVQLNLAYRWFCSRAISEYLDALHEDGSSIAPPTPPKKVSQTDPLARWTSAPGGPAYLVDTKAGVIVDVEATGPTGRSHVPTLSTTKPAIVSLGDRSARNLLTDPTWTIAPLSHLTSFPGTLIFLGFSLLCPFRQIAQAEEQEDQSPPWYVGGGFSLTDITAGSFGGLNSGSDSTDPDDGILVTLGYTFNRSVAVEIGYLDAGAPRFESSRGLLCTDPDPCRVQAEQDTEAITVAAVGILPLGPVWELYGKAGLADWRAVAHQTRSSPLGGVSIRSRVDLDGRDFLVGLGVAAAVAPRVRIRLDYEFFDTDNELLAVDRAAGFQQFAVEMHWRF